MADRGAACGRGVVCHAGHQQAHCLWGGLIERAGPARVLESQQVHSGIFSTWLASLPLRSSLDVAKQNPRGFN